jgi:sulfate adenylyltransferase subunit 1
MRWYDGPTLMETLDNIEIDHDINLMDFRFPVQWVCRPGSADYHDFRGYMGRIESGTVKAAMGSRCCRRGARPK